MACEVNCWKNKHETFTHSTTVTALYLCTSEHILLPNLEEYIIQYTPSKRKNWLLHSNQTHIALNCHSNAPEVTAGGFKNIKKLPTQVICSSLQLFACISSLLKISDPQRIKGLVTVMIVMIS